MKVAFDTSVIVPALIPALPEHARAYAWLRAARDKRIEGTMSWHAFAEAWSVLTRIPIRPSPTPAAARDSLASIEKVVRPRPLDAGAYRAAAQRCVDQSLRSGAIFDALHLISAESERAEVFVTANVADFERLIVAGSPRLVGLGVAMESVLGRGRK
jgi:predicted nucleic acid-binding protein